MRKQWMAGLLAVLLMLTGCSPRETVRKLDAVEEQVEEQLDRAEDRLERDLRQKVLPRSQEQPEAPESTELLTEEEALQIALDHLGFASEQITRQRVVCERDDGVWQYEVSFRQGDWDYEFEIQGETGAILSFDREHKYD